MHVFFWNGLIGDALDALLDLPAARVAPHQAASALLDGRADLALVRPLDVLRAPEDFEVVPGVGVVSQAWPLARLLVKGMPSTVKTVGFFAGHAQAILLARVLLKEHYGLEPTFTPYAAPDPAPMVAENDAVLVLADHFPANDVPEGLWVMDLGREWYELTTRPFVWGVFAARPGTLSPPQVGALQVALTEPGPAYANWVAAQPKALADWMTEHVTFTLRGYALPGLDAFSDYLYYHRALSEIPDLPFIKIAKPGDAPDPDPFDADQTDDPTHE